MEPPSLETLELDDPGTATPDGVRALIEEAHDRALAFLDRAASQPPGGFLSCDNDVLWRALAEIRRRELAPGERFCEWGSGFGVVTLLAAGLGFEACGIEVQPELVGEAQTLAREFGIHARYGAGNFVPPGTRFPPESERAYSLIRTPTPDGHSALGATLADFDLIYVYPWPDEEWIAETVFTQHARSGALLLTFDGDDWVTLRRRS